jgi:hypothetical protein
MTEMADEHSLMAILCASAVWGAAAVHFVNLSEPQFQSRQMI